MLDSDVRPLTPIDLDSSASAAALFISYTRITMILGDLTEHALRGTLGIRDREAIEEALLHWIADLPPEYHLHDRMTGSLNVYTFTSRHLHAPYFVALMILFRQKHSDRGPSMPSLVAAGFVSGVFEEYIDYGAIGHLSPPSIFYIFTTVLTQLSSHRFSDLVPTNIANKEIQIAQMALGEFKQRFVTAVGAERVVNHTLRLSRQSAAASHLRPVDKTVSQRESEFFALFGPGLCDHWSIVEASVNGRARPQPAHQTASLAAGANALDGGNEWLGIGASFGETSADAELQVGLGDNLADDAFSRLWWSDWTTQP